MVQTEDGHLMRLAVIIPTWNEAAKIDSALVRAQDLGPEEIWVVDGGSRDDTVARARQHRCQVLESPVGRALQQNLGAKHAGGDVLLFLHADTWLEPAARGQLETALAEPRVLGGAFRQRIESPRGVYRWLEWGNAARVRWWGLAYGDQGIFVRRETFFALGGFPPVKLLEDLLFMRRLAERTRPVLLAGPLHVSARRWERHGVLRQTARNWAILAAHRWGVSPDRLADYYTRHGG